MENIDITFSPLCERAHGSKFALLEASHDSQLSFLIFIEISQDRKAMTHRDDGCVNPAWASVYTAARSMCGRSRSLT